MCTVCCVCLWRDSTIDATDSYTISYFNWFNVDFQFKKVEKAAQ